MDRFTYIQRLSRIEDDLPKLGNTINALKITDAGIYGQNLEALGIDAARRAERISCSLRNLIFAADLVAPPILMEQVAQEQGITITHTAELVEITLPGLMPKRTKKGNTTYLTDPLYYSLEAYTKEHELPHFEECVVCFTHVFDKKLSARRIRDYDNLECKQILDTASGFLMTDDSGLLCDAYHSTRLGKKDCTILSIMERKHFPKWLKEQEKGADPLSVF